MGYRSDVGIKCGTKAFKKFRDAYEKYNFEPDKIYRGKSYFGAQEYLLLWECVKWYDYDIVDYADVVAITRVMDELDEIEDPSHANSYKFLRLGEEDTDVEARTNNWDIELYFTRAISIDKDMQEVE